MKLGLPLSQFCVGESPERNVARAARKNADPCLAWRANPNRAVIVAVRVRLVPPPRPFGAGAPKFPRRVGGGRGRAGGPAQVGWGGGLEREQKAYARDV